MTDEQLYKTLSYFDIKNLAGWIKCPVLMGAGLQDPVCPPHTNFSGYNLITSPKEFIIYPNKEHTVDYSDWSPRVNRFYERYLSK
jgi:cephalosporin-C deacetylase